MYETMELRGFDEEDRLPMEIVQKNSTGDQKRGAGPARIQQSRISAGGMDSRFDKDLSTQRSADREFQSSKRDSKSQLSQPAPGKPAIIGDKLIGKMPAE